MGLKRAIRTAFRKFKFVLLNYETFLFLLRHRGLDANRLFRASWRILDKTRSGIIVDVNINNVPEVQVLHYEYRQIFRLFFPSFRPEIRMSDDAILEKMSSAPFLIVTVHAFSEYAICKILDSRGLRTVFVSHSPYNDEEIASYGFQSPPLNMLLTPKLFLELRATIRSGLSIVCDADFATMGPGSARERFISLSIFEFKRLVGVDLYFACNRVRNNGVIECFIEEPDMSEKVSPNAVAARFIAFVDRVQGRSSNLRIGDWSRLTADRPHRYSAEKRVRKHRARKSAPN